MPEPALTREGGSQPNFGVLSVVRVCSRKKHGSGYYSIPNTHTTFPILVNRKTVSTTQKMPDAVRAYNTRKLLLPGCNNGHLLYYRNKPIKEIL